MNKLIVWSQCFIHLSGTIHSTLMFTVFPSLPAKRPSPWVVGKCHGLGRHVAAVSTVNVDSPVISQGGPWVANRYTLLTNTAAVFYRIKMVSMNLSRDQLYSHEYLRELTFLFPSLENYGFCCFSKKQQQKTGFVFPFFYLA